MYYRKQMKEMADAIRVKAGVERSGRGERKLKKKGRRGEEVEQEEREELDVELEEGEVGSFVDLHMRDSRQDRQGA